MKLSDTKNPKTGNPFTVEQLQKGARHFGLSWKMDNSTDPELAPALAQAVTELGWTNPNATMKRAVDIQTQPKPKIGVEWYNNTVTVNGELRCDLSPAKLAKLQNAVGDGFSGRISGEFDMAEVAACKFEAPLPGKKTAQCWDNPDSDKPVYR